MELKKHHQLQPRHKYQLEVIFLFVTGLFLFVPYYLILDEFGLDKLKYQWYFFWPFMAFYIIYSLYTRNKIRDEEKINPYKRHLVYWMLLGLIIIFFQIQPNDLEKLQSIDISFLVFTLFLADSYWDFKKNKSL